MKRAACVLLIREDGKILGASRRNNPTDFNLVGGKVDPGETIKEAAVREFFEETGVLLDPKNLQEVYTRPCYGEIDFQTTTFLVFQCDDPEAMKINGDVPNSPEPGILIRWVSWERLLNPNSSFSSYNKKLFEKLQYLL